MNSNTTLPFLKNESCDFGPEDIDPDDLWAMSCANETYDITGAPGTVWTPDHSMQFQTTLRQAVPTREMYDLYYSEHSARVRQIAEDHHFELSEAGHVINNTCIELLKLQDGLTQWLDQDVLELLATMVMEIPVTVLGSTRTMWEQLKVHETSLLRPGQDFMFFAMLDAVYGPHYGALCDLPKRLPQKAANSITSLLSVKPVVVEKKYYFAVLGANLEDITFYNVPPLSMFMREFDVNYDGVIYSFAKGSGAYPVDVPLVPHHWLSIQLAPAIKRPYVDMDSYSGNEHYYQTISREHERVLRQIGETLPKGIKVVAPGDGYGSVLTACPQQIVQSSDRILPAFRDMRVQKLSMSLAIRGDYDVLILSFVSIFLKARDLQYLRDQKKRIIIVDTHPILYGGMVTDPKFVSYHCTAYGVDGLKVTAIPEFDRRDTVRFSENLLKLPPFHLESFNHGIRYLKMMQPLRQYGCPVWMRSYLRSQGMSVRETSNIELRYSAHIQEHIRNSQIGPSYFYRIGRVERTVIEMNWSTTMYFKPRTVYSIQQDKLKCTVPTSLEVFRSASHVFVWTPIEDEKIYRTESIIPGLIMGTDWRFSSRSQVDTKTTVFRRQGKTFLKFESPEGGVFDLEMKSSEVSGPDKVRYNEWCKTNTPIVAITLAQGVRDLMGPKVKTLPGELPTT